MKAATAKATAKWFIRKNQDGAGYWAVAVSADGKREAVVGPWGKPLPTVEAVRQYIRNEWHGGNPRNMPGSVQDNVGEMDEVIASRCLFDLC